MALNWEHTAVSVAFSKRHTRYIAWQKQIFALLFGEVLKWWRGAPAKGVGRVSGARVQISPSPPTGTPCKCWKDQCLPGVLFFYFYLFDTLKHIFLHGSVVKKVVRFRVHFTTGRLAVGAHRENSEECTGLCINILSSVNVKDRTSLVEESNSPENISDI